MPVFTTSRVPLLLRVGDHIVETSLSTPIPAPEDEAHGQGEGSKGWGQRCSPPGLFLVSCPGWGRGRWDGPLLPRWLGPAPHPPQALSHWHTKPLSLGQFDPAQEVVNSFKKTHSSRACGCSWGTERLDSSPQGHHWAAAGRFTQGGAGEEFCSPGQAQTVP